MKNYKHLTFWSLVERLQDYRRCHYLHGRGPQGHQINSRKIEVHVATCTDICPGITAYYNTASPVNITLAMLFRNKTGPLASVYPLEEGRTAMVYSVHTVTGNTPHGDRLVKLHRWARMLAGDDAVPQKTAAALPQYDGQDVPRVSQRLTAILDADGFVSRWLRDYPGSSWDADVLFRPSEHSTGIGNLINCPLFSCWSWWHPGKLALAAAEWLQRETQPFGRFWIRPHVGRINDKNGWHGCVTVVSPDGDSWGLSVGARDSVGKVTEQRDAVLSWAMNKVAIPGPMF